MTTNSTLSHDIAEKLRGEILRQQYRCGERLPSERDLASRFDASRGAVREALSQVEQVGLIQIQPGGARVQAIDAASISVLGPLMAINEVPDPTLVDQFLQTFGALASLSAREGVAKAGDEQLNRLREIVTEIARQSGNFEQMQQQWQELLETMGEIADNLVVQLIGNDLKAQFVEQMTSLEMKPELNSNTANPILSALQQSIDSHDGDQAALAIQWYFDELRLAVNAALQQKLNGYRRQAV